MMDEVARNAWNDLPASIREQENEREAKIVIKKFVLVEQLSVVIVFVLLNVVSITYTFLSEPAVFSIHGFSRFKTVILHLQNPSSPYFDFAITLKINTVNAKLLEKRKSSMRSCNFGSQQVTFPGFQFFLSEIKGTDARNSIITENK